ncbi:globin family protein [Planktothrix mougeotii]|uniref:Phycobilisome protein n=1 Tax=Planktothrix mougeotii LEGE 06226 TaxID=1828728 RepID=A0ABR9UDM7_9CYAN|nr:phycobilisome protein [Planktothrix mougeotii]MBE9144570.1 phycobilisome protein [Planktothrix mougeotii LEGE 06226]
MQAELNELLVQAENRYLQTEELVGFKSYAETLAQRLKIYEFLRDREIAIFQPIADQISSQFPHEKEERLEEILQQWILILRHSAMAMLLNDSEYLQQRVIEWLSGLVKAHNTQSIDTQIYQLLTARLNELISPKATVFLQPFLEQIKTNLLEGGTEKS